MQMAPKMHMKEQQECYYKNTSIQIYWKFYHEKMKYFR